MKNNLRLLALALGIGVAMPALAQKDNVGIGTTKPDQSAILDLNSSNKGLLMPRMSLQQRSGIQNPAQGLVIYQTDFLSGFYFYDGKEWKPMTSETNANSVADANNWGISGNSGVTNANFIGVPFSTDINFKIGTERAGLIDASAGKNIFLGQRAGNANTGSFNAAFGGEAFQVNTSGSYNAAFGYQTLQLNNGDNNMAVGAWALRFNETGVGNSAIGTSALYNLVAGSHNVAIGNQSLVNAKGSRNTGVGAYALNSLNTGGQYNTAIGYGAGQGNVSGSSNIFIGYEAGLNETLSNKLYIANSNTALPLVYGDFSAKFISIGDVGVVGDPAATLVKRNNLATQYGLLVQKGILTEKIKVATMTTTDWADYVFEKDYKVMPLEEVEAFVKENKHLPNVPTTVEMMASGSDLIKTDAKLLEKIEELTLYMIEMNKEIKALKVENAKLKK